jgi:hypothetical protein
METRLQSYSCKLITHEKKQWKEIACDCDPHGIEALAARDPDVNMSRSQNNNSQRSPPFDSLFSSSISSDPGTYPELRGREVRDAIERKTLFYLTATLNACFPDYDFTDATGESFSRHFSYKQTMEAVNDMFSKGVDGFGSLKDALWNTINCEIDLKMCRIYSYRPDNISDPFSFDGTLWTFNYFFYNSRLKRLIFLCCRAVSKQVEVNADEFQTQWSMEKEP